MKPDVADRAVELAESLLRQALQLRTPAEQKHGAKLAGLIGDDASKQLSVAMADRVIRSSDASRSAGMMRQILNQFGIPKGFRADQRLLMAIGSVASKLIPFPVMFGVKKVLRAESRSVILAAEEVPLKKYLARRKVAGWRVNLNPLGEAILGETEAKERLNALLKLLARDDVNYVSVKISAIFSQINVIAWRETIDSIKKRLRILYRAVLPTGKFVNLDMEEYRDLALTAAAFRELLDEPEFHSISAGIVLQAYLPDAWAMLQELTAWALQRVQNGGAPIKIRIVKGANLAMENVEASLHGWTSAPYPTKADTDANFKRMVDYAIRPDHLTAVRIGVASHNLFDVALALILREERSGGHAVEIEMLEGMANHQARAVRDRAGDLLVYAPIVYQKDFGNALAYLIRRLDENTSPENFLAHLFDLMPGSNSWNEQKERFVTSWANRDHVTSNSRRAALPARPKSGFSNTPDTDWTQSIHRDAIPHEKMIARPAGCSIDDVLVTAVEAQPGWEALGDLARGDILRQCAKVIQDHRMETIAVLRGEGKKAMIEADSEISEAADFANYYAEIGSAPAGVTAKAIGVVVVTPPWNFPFAIPCGGVLAALMAGNGVVLKPAPEVVGIGFWLAELLWKAGVPRNVLQCVNCADDDQGRSLITDPRTACVVLTGGYQTARMFQSWRPTLLLYAETSGKNAMIVSAMADRDLAIKDLIKSAFGHSGQKCSAASLLILEAEVYDDPTFRRQLADAVASLPVGPASDPTSIITPLITPPGDSLRRAFTTLDPGEEWLLKPTQNPIDPCLWSPGIKWGVEANSWFHLTECFGPVLGVMRAADLAEAVTLQNAVAYGLTAGFHSLDETEIDAWRDKVQAGNLYINRSTTGAIVQRQPFGGWKRSSIGPGSKAGGPNYVNLFRSCTDAASTTLEQTSRNFANAWTDYFSVDQDPSALDCERNVFRYRPCRGVILRLTSADAKSQAIAQLAAAQCGVLLIISIATDESDANFAARLPQLSKTAEFLRTDFIPDDAVLRAAYAVELNWIHAPISAVGRIELPRWLREQSVSQTRHRYGNIDPTPLV